MKKFSKILVLLLALVMWSNRVFAADNLVNIYFFHSNTCSHCKAEGKLLEELMNEYDNIKIYKYEEV